MKIGPAIASEIAAIRELFLEYQTGIGVSPCFQNFDQEVVQLPGDYAPPSGRLFVARNDKEIAGCVALRSLGENICEMKRLFVRPAFRNLGLGRKLTDMLISEARTMGYRKMRLDTLPGTMDRAIAMYRALGFREIPRYYDNPHGDALYMELDL